MANNKTKNFQLEYLARGSSYSSAIDYRRFVTLDYNLESYIGVVGVGIIDGWQIEQISGLTIQILPGNGVISGYAVESPYSYKQRSDMIMGEREIEEIHDKIDPSTGLPYIYSYLTTDQKASYVAIIQAYDPTYIPSTNIENCFVKIVTPYVIILPDETEKFIYASRISGMNPYPESNDYPIYNGIKPDDLDFSNYTDYNNALTAYLAQIQIINNYEWRTNIANHYNAVEFTLSTTYEKRNDKILIGKVSTAGGIVTNIDVSKIESLSGMEAAIKEAAKKLIYHVHGGNKYFDPPKINLETDIRDAAIKEYDNKTNVAIFNVLERQHTSVELGHQHTFFVSNSSGYTVDVIGTFDNHYHNIIEEVVENPTQNPSSVADHIHTIPSEDTIGGWTNTSSFIVTLNDVVIGTQSSTNIAVDSNVKTLTISGLIGPTYRTYSSSFDVNTGTTTEKYSYSTSSYNVLEFMLSMISDFNAKYGTSLNKTNDNGTLDLSNNPFLFVADDGVSIAPFTDLYNQSLIAQKLLKNEGDLFLFTPDAARNIQISLDKIFLNNINDYDVRIEILGNTEVTGILGTDNITYVNAEKIQFGQFDLVRIPQISHVGRMGSEVLPIKYPLTSADGITYSVNPSITTIELGHYHSLFLDNDNGGASDRTYVGDEAVYYATDDNGVSYFIDHVHGVTNSNVSSASSSGLLEWQHAINTSTNTITSSDHIHNIVYPVIGDQKIIYSLKEGVNGTIYAGTSSGVMVIPNSSTYDSYLYVVNGQQYNMIGNDLWTLLLKSKQYYESQTGNVFIVTSNVYGSQITEAYDYLLNHGDSYLLYGNIDAIRGQDKVMIKKLDYFELPNFKVTRERRDGQLERDEIFYGLKFIDPITGEEVPKEQATEDDIKVFIVEKELSYTPIWSIDLKKDSNNVSENIVVAGTDVLAKNYDLDLDLYKSWKEPELPDFSGSVKKIFNDSFGSTWIITNGGIVVSRNHQDLNIVETVNQPGLEQKVSDILESPTGTFLVACDDGIYKTENQGFSWTRIFHDQSGCNQIIRDFAVDKTTTVLSHYHTLSVNCLGDGILSPSIGSIVSHTHSVTSWNIGTTLVHTHTLIESLYTITGNGEIYKSSDNGVNWIKALDAPSGEHGDIFVNNSKLVVSLSDGLYTPNQYFEWIKIFDNVVYSYGYTYDLSEILLGCSNIIYKTSDFSTFTVVQQMDGSPMPMLYSNNIPSLFGYCYSAKDNSFRFKDIEYSQTQSFALVDFGIWIVSGGSWDSNVKYDIYIDDKTVLSNKKNIDNRSIYDYNFSIDPNNGTIDFSGNAIILTNTNIYDDSFAVDNPSNFTIGDKILIKSSQIVAPLTSTGNIQEDYNAFMSYSETINQISNMFFYTTISDIIGNQIYVSEKFDKEITIPSKVYKIPSVNAESNIIANIYESYLSNIGQFSHEEIEDKLSAVSDGKPYCLNNTFLSNLLQLTQALKYAYPDIDTKLKNSKFYDFRYSWLTTDPIYPYIGDIIDLPNCDIYNFGLFANDFYSYGAKRINRILVGSGKFDGLIFVATDIGVFWSKIEDGLEQNWFFSTLNEAVNDIIIFGERILACTANGTYATNDMISWSLETSGAIDFSASRASLRWVGTNTANVAAHTATFSNGYGDITDIGSISSTTNVYSVLSANRKIEISNAGNANGVYTVSQIIDASNILTYETFPIVIAETHVGVTMRMGSWWEYFSGNDNPDFPTITNTLIIGGKNKISFCTNAYSNVWQESFIPPSIDDFQISCFCPLDDGTIIASTTSTKETNVASHIINCTGIGDSWNIVNKFGEITGIISSFSLTEFEHTKLTVSYSIPNAYMDGNIAKHQLTVLITGSTEEFYNGYIIWNENINGDYIYVYGNTLNTILSTLLESDKLKLTFIVAPIKINSITELSDKTIFYGTDSGIYTDNKASLYPYIYSGEIKDVGIGGAVSRIDISGIISSAQKNLSNSNTLFYIKLDENVGSGDLNGKFLYVTDIYPVQAYIIVSNGTTLVNGETAIEVNYSFINSFLDYVGKRSTIVGKASSRIYLTFNSIVSYNQFCGGKACISSSGMGFGKEYNIIGNTDQYIDVSPVIVPPSTTYSIMNDNYNLVIGQSIRLLDSSNRVNLFVTFDNSLRENQLTNMKVNISDDNGSEASDITNISVYSNDINMLTLNPLPSTELPAPLAFNIGDRFTISGFMFDNLHKFDNKITTIDTSHYHDVNTVGDVVSGEISSFSNVSSSYVDIYSINTYNLNTPLMLLSDDLLKDAEITFINPNNTNMWYKTKVVNHTSSNINVRTKDLDNWDFIEYNQYKISEGWLWTIPAYNYGYTENIYYKDFSVLTSYITQDIEEGDNIINIVSSAGMLVGDKIVIRDENQKSEIAHILLIGATNVQVSSNITQFFFKKDNTLVEVLRDTFTNNHAHQIRNCQVETLIISDYLNAGYTSSHSHQTKPLISNISEVIERNGEISAIGNSEKIFSSYNSNGNWEILVDLSNYLECTDTISNITDIIIDNDGKYIVGTENGYIATDRKIVSIVPLEKPVVT